MRQDVIDRQVRAMKAAGLDAIVSCSPENFAYVTGFLSPTQPLMRWRHALALVTADGTAALVVVDMEASTIRAKAVRAPNARTSRDRGVARIRVRRDGGAGRPADAPRPRKRPHRHRARLPAGCGFRRALAAAAAREIRARRRRCWRGCARSRRRKRSTSCANSPASPTAPSRRPMGRSPPARPRWILPPRSPAGVYEQGAEYFKLMIVATGERSVFPNVGPTARVLKRGDVCRVEIFPIIAGYHAGVCRTAAVGSAAAAGRAHLGQSHRLQAHAARRHPARRLEPGHLRAVPQEDRGAEPAAHFLRRPRHRAAPARRPLSRPRRPAARSRHGARHRAA